MSNNPEKKKKPKKAKKSRSRRKQRKAARKQMKKLRKEFEKDVEKRRKESHERMQAERAERAKKTKSGVRKTHSKSAAKKTHSKSHSKSGVKKTHSKSGVKRTQSKSSEDLGSSSNMSLSAFTIGTVSSSTSIAPHVNRETEEVSPLHSEAQKQQRKDIENSLQNDSELRSPSEWQEKESRGEHVEKKDIQFDNKLQQVPIDTIINAPRQKQTQIHSPSNWADSKLEEDSETKDKLKRLPDNID